MGTAQATVKQGSAFSNVGRITTSTGGYAVAADITSIDRIVYERMTHTVALGTDSLTPSSHFSAITTSSIFWPVDTTGYNFIDHLPVTAAPDAAKDYVCQYTFTPADSSAAFVVDFIVKTSLTVST